MLTQRMELQVKNIEVVPDGQKVVNSIIERLHQHLASQEPNYNAFIIDLNIPFLDGVRIYDKVKKIY